MIAQIGDLEAIKFFAQFGLGAAMLAWFAFRFEKKIEAHSQIINDLCLSINCEILSRDELPHMVRQTSEEILKRAQDRKRPNFSR